MCNLFNKKIASLLSVNILHKRQFLSEATGTSLFLNPKPVISVTQAFIVAQSVTILSPPKIFHYMEATQW